MTARPLPRQRGAGARKDGRVRGVRDRPSAGAITTTRGKDGVREQPPAYLLGGHIGLRENSLRIL